MAVGKQKLRYTNKKRPRYWIVVGQRVSRNRKPFRHPTKPQAITEAIRLANLYPDQVFTVFEAQLKFKKFPDKDPLIGPLPLSLDEKE